MTNTTEPVTATVGIVQLLEATGLGDTFDELMVKQLNARNLKRGTEAETYIFSKLDTLTEYVTANKKEEGTTIAELKTLIGDWIAAQEWLTKQAQEVVKE